MNDTQKEKKYTTTAVKREWNKAHYTQIKCSLPKELAKQFRETAKVLIFSYWNVNAIPAAAYT